MAGSKPIASLEDSGHPARTSPERITPEQIRMQLQRILASTFFVRSERLCRFLRFTVELTLSGEMDRIKEYTLGRDVFDRDKNYDPRADSIVRVEARRLRRKLGSIIERLVLPIRSSSAGYLRADSVPVFLPRQPASTRLTQSTAILPDPRPLNPRTVAVLPFRNLSSDPDQDFFCEGIAEEILNTLTTVPQLNVVARTSVFRFKGSHDVREIGRQLHAGTVIEGSVRKAGNRMRISAQAIDAASGILLWSGTFDRDLTDVFAVQDESRWLLCGLAERDVGDSERCLADGQAQARARSLHAPSEGPAFLESCCANRNASGFGEIHACDVALSRLRRAICGSGEAYLKLPFGEWCRQVKGFRE